MSRTIRVVVGEEALPVGSLLYDRQGSRESAAFSYDATWLTNARRFPIDPALPLVTGAQFHKRAANGSIFHGAIADTEADGWGRRVIARDHAKRRRVERRVGDGSAFEPLAELDYLLVVDDVSRIGALRFIDERGVFQRPPDPTHRTTPPLIQLAHLVSASRALETNSETAADLAYLRGRGTSLGGLRPKCTIVDVDGTLSIGKFPSVGDERAVTKGEVLAMNLARRAGIDVADARLVDSDGTPVAIIRRFDRPPTGGRLMYLSAATMIGASRNSGEHFYTELVDALRRDGSRTDEDIEQLWRRIAFSVLITNVDDHLQNHGFLHVENGLWRLAPAFDLNPFPERVREFKTWISEDVGPEATIDALMSVIGYFRITAVRAKAILEEVVRAVAGWRAEARRIGMTHADLQDFEDAFEHAERTAANRILGRKR